MSFLPSTSPIVTPAGVISAQVLRNRADHKAKLKVRRGEFIGSVSKHFKAVRSFAASKKNEPRVHLTRVHVRHPAAETVSLAATDGYVFAEVFLDKHAFASTQDLPSPGQYEKKRVADPLPGLTFETATKGCVFGGSIPLGPLVSRVKGIRDALISVGFSDDTLPPVLTFRFETTVLHFNPKLILKALRFMHRLRVENVTVSLPGENGIKSVIAFKSPEVRTAVAAVRTDDPGLFEPIIIYAR